MKKIKLILILAAAIIVGLIAAPFRIITIPADAILEALKKGIK